MKQITRNQRVGGKSGFTLIELLVVISIISLLVALLLPALKAARTAASLSKSLANVKQIMMSLHGYAADNKSSLPWASFHPTDERYDQWTAKLAPSTSSNPIGLGYVSTGKIFWSPDHIPNGNLESPRTVESPPDYRWSGYGANWWGPMPALMHQNRTAASGSLSPLKLDVGSPSDPSMVKHAQMLGIVETNNSYMSGKQAPPRLWSGTHLMHPGNIDGLFSYNGAVAQGYIDGHGLADDALNLGWRVTAQRDGSWFSTSYDSQNDARSHRDPWFSRFNVVHDRTW